MSRQSPAITVKETPGCLHESLAAAQQAALKATAADLAKIFRSLLAAGILVQVNGRIVPANS